MFGRATIRLGISPHSIVRFRFSFCVFVYAEYVVYFCVLAWTVLLFAFVVLGLVSSVLRQEVGWKERLRNDLVCVEWDVKPFNSDNQLAPRTCWWL